MAPRGANPSTSGTTDDGPAMAQQRPTEVGRAGAIQALTAGCRCTHGRAASNWAATRNRTSSRP